MAGKSRYGTVGSNSPAIIVQPALGITDPKGRMVKLSKLFRDPTVPTDTDADKANVYDDKLMRTMAKGYFYDPIGPEVDPALWPEGVDRTYSGSPNIATDVQQEINKHKGNPGMDGYPANPYTPNPSATTPGSDNPGDKHVVEASDPFGSDMKLPDVGLNGTVDPKKSAHAIVSVNENFGSSLIPGKSGAGV